MLSGSRIGSDVLICWIAGMDEAIELLPALYANPANRRLTFVASEWLSYATDPMDLSSTGIPLSFLKGSMPVHITIIMNRVMMMMIIMFPF